MKAQTRILKPWATLKLVAAGAIVIGMSMLVVACSDDDGDTTTNTITSQAITPAATNTGDSTTSTSTSSRSTTSGATSSGSGSAATEADIEAFVQGFVDAYNEGDADGFFGAMSDETVRAFLEMYGLDTSDLEAAKQEAATILGQSPLNVREIKATDVSDTSASADLISVSQGVLEGDRVELARDGDRWVISALDLFAASPEVPEGYATYDMGLDEFAFDLQGDVKAGETAFAMTNNGEQPHEAVLVRLDEGVDLMQALQSPQQPEGVEIMGGVLDVEPGASYNLVFTDPLDAGRYAFVCFLADLTEGPGGTPHAFKGMTLEFNVQ